MRVGDAARRIFLSNKPYWPWTDYRAGRFVRELRAWSAIQRARQLKKTIVAVLCWGYSWLVRAAVTISPVPDRLCIQKPLAKEASPGERVKDGCPGGITGRNRGGSRYSRGTRRESRLVAIATG